MTYFYAYFNNILVVEVVFVDKRYYFRKLKLY